MTACIMQFGVKAYVFTLLEILHGKLGLLTHHTIVQIVYLVINGTATQLLQTKIVAQ